VELKRLLNGRRVNRVHGVVMAMLSFWRLFEVQTRSQVVPNVVSSSGGLRHCVIGPFKNVNKCQIQNACMPPCMFMVHVKTWGPYIKGRA
jgi:hypothetical protein